eukprot:s283_g2.t2
MSRGDGSAVGSPVPPSDDENVERIPRQGAQGRARERPVLPEAMTETEQFRLFQRFMESQARGRRATMADESEGELAGGEGRGSAGPPPEWDGQTPFEDFLIRAKLWIATTKSKPTARGPLLLKALKGPPFESFKHLAKDASWLSSATNAEELLRKMDTPDYFGDDKEEHLLASLSRITYHMKRQKQESWREYFARWESALRKVREHSATNPIYFAEDETEQDSEEDITEIEHYLAELQDQDCGGDLPDDEVFSEKEAAEILATVLEKKKRKTFIQTQKAKKYHELSRGYGGKPHGPSKFGRDKRFGGQGRGLTIQEIKLRTKCGICGKVGHWHRECPTKEENKAEKEAHFLDKDFDFGTSSEVHFCGLLENEPYMIQPNFKNNTIKNQVKETFPDKDDYRGRHYQLADEQYMISDPFAYQDRATSSSSNFDGRFQSGSVQPFSHGDMSTDGPLNLFDHSDDAAYMASVSELFFFETAISKAAKVKGYEVDENACATLDTGCQRLAIGLDTLKAMLPFVPQPLEISLVKSQNRFKSVHGISTTHRLAVVPSSLGNKGSILRPAIFEDEHGREVPFLLSLPLLLHGGCHITLEPNQGLFLRLGHKGEQIRCHLGPSGSLRVPVMQFDQTKVSCLARDLARLARDEFEILTTSLEPMPFDSASVSARNTSLLCQPPALSDLHSNHDGRVDQACPQPAELRCPGRMAASFDPPLGLAVADHSVDREASQEGRGSSCRRLSQEPEQLEPSQCCRTRDTTTPSKQHIQDEKPLRERIHLHHQCEHSEPPQKGASGRPARAGDPHGRGTEVPLRNDCQTLHGIHRRPQPREGVLEMPKTDRAAVPLLCVAGLPADERSGGVEIHGGRDWSPEEPTRDHATDDPEEVPSQEDQQARIQRDACPSLMQCVPKGDQLDQTRGDRQSEEGSQLRIDHTCHRNDPSGHGTVPAVPALPEGSERLRRKVKNSLKKAVSFWKTIQELFSSHGVDDDTTTKKLRSLHEEIVSDLMTCPRGSKRVQEIAEAMHLTTRNLKTVAEIYNPGCFSRLAKQHGLEPGLAFDITLGHDLLCPKNRAHVKDYVQTVRPGLVLLAPPCHMYSQLQNLLKELREHDAEAMSRYLKKKRRAHILLSFAVEIAELCRELGLTFVLEHPWSSESWQTKVLKRLLGHSDVYLSRTDQCLFGLKGVSGELQRKRTGFATNNLEIAKVLNQQCKGQHAHEHIIGGSRSRRSQQYPEDLLHAILHTYRRTISQPVECTRSEDLLLEDLRFDQWFVQHAQPVTEEPSSEIYANAFAEEPEEGEEPEDAAMAETQSEGYEPSIFQGDLEPRENLHPGGVEGPFDHRGDDHDDLPEDPPGDEPGDLPQPDAGHPLQPQRPRTLKTLIRRAHEGLGHPHRERFLKILKYSNASEEVMKEARKFECTACIRNKTVRPARRACPPREIQINEVVGADLVWLTTPDGSTRPALNLIDWNTHFQMMIPMKNKKPESVRQAYRHWIRFFGPPKTLALDLGREFEGSFALRAESDGTFVDPSSLESPYQRGITERAGKTFKLMLAKAMENHDCADMEEWEELVGIVAMQKNRLLMHNGFSPLQRVVGFNPRIPGGLLSGDADNRSFPEHVRLGDQGVIKAMQMRKAASIAFHSTECSQALRRAIESGPRPMRSFEVGETVYFWRVGLGSTRKPAPAYWHGPAKVVMTDPPSTLWLSYQGTLVKASPERVRKSADEEMLTLSGWIDALLDTRAQLDAEPKRGFLDITNDPIPEEDLRAGLQDEPEDGVLPDDDDDVPREEQPHRRQPALAWRLRDDVVHGPIPPLRGRITGKRPAPAPEWPENEETMKPDGAEPDPAIEPVENPPEVIDTPGEEAEHGGQKREAEQETGWEPTSKRTRLEYLEIYYAKVSNLIQARQRKEVQINTLGSFKKESFKKAMQKEITNNINTGAYKALSIEESARVRREHPEKVMESRYVTTAKPLEPIDIEPAKSEGLLLDWDQPEPCKAKVRHVMKGFSEEGAEFLDSTTPQVTREGVMMVAQIIASFRWRLGFLDFTQAFHSGDPINRLLFAEQPKEGIPGMVPGQLVQLLKTCYGLTDGPFAWFSHIKRFLIEELGYTQSIADPCVFMLHTGTGTQRRLHGIIGLATDDMIHGGDDLHQHKMSMIQKRYKLGKFQFDFGKFTGKDFKMEADGSIFISQPNYADNIEKIQLDKQRSKHRYSLCTDAEVSRLRTALGALAWLAKETRPELAGRVALLQQSMPKPRVQDLVEANLIIADAKKFSSAGIRMMPITPDNLRVGVASDASWGNSRCCK